MAVDLKAKKRSKLRLFVGKRYFMFRRYLSWYLGNESFAKVRDDKFNFISKTHSTPVFRKLKDVDMWYQRNKKINLQLAIKKIDGVVINPSETFSFWKLVGKPTKRKGYLNGMILSHGKFFAGVGGGLCQLTNLIYWLAVHTQLTVNERYRHSYDVFPDSSRTQPFGSGATCVYNYRDIKLKNETPFMFKLNFKIQDDQLVGEITCSSKPIYTYEVFQKDHNFKLEYWGGYSRNNTIFRRAINKDGDVVREEFVVENHAITMYSPMLPEKTA